MMNKQTEYPEALIQQYVTGSMNEVDEYEFEALMLSNDSLMAQVQAAQSIVFGLSELSDGCTANVDAIEAQVDGFNLSKILDSIKAFLWNPAPAYAMAFTSVIFIALVGRAPLGGGQTISELDVLSFSTQATRNLSQSSELIIEPKGEQAGLFIKIKTPIAQDEQHYVKLASADNGELIWTSSVFEIGSLRDQLIVIPKGLPNQPMRVEVWSIDTTDKSSRRVEFCHYSEACR